MSFEFHHTCPEIDRGIDSARDEVEAHLDDFICEASPLFYYANNGIDKNKYIRDYINSTFKAIEDIFEKVRSTNESMRSEAEIQVESLEETIEELEAEIKEKNSLIESLESQID